MFDGFQQGKDGRARRRLAVTTGASLALYAAIGGAVLAFAGQAVRAPEPEEIDVSFAPPPPPVAAAPPPPPPPPVPKGVEVKRVAKPSPRPALAAPVEVPTEKPSEIDPANAAPVEIGDGVAGVEGGTGTAAVDVPPVEAPPPPPPPVVRRADPINLPESATPPTPAADNAQPEYPADARAAGREGQVILKIVVSDRGEVTRVEVMRGEEPFTSAATAVVRRWRYSPALVDGQPTAVFRIVKIPFRIKA